MDHWHALSLMSPIASYTKAQISHLTHGPTLNRTHSLSRFLFLFFYYLQQKIHHPNLPPPLWTASSSVATCLPPPMWTAPLLAIVQAIGATASHGQVKPLPHAVHPGARHHQQEQLLFSPARMRWLGVTASTTTTNGTACIQQFFWVFYWPRPFFGSLQWRLSIPSHLNEMALERCQNAPWMALEARLEWRLKRALNGTWNAPWMALEMHLEWSR